MAEVPVIAASPYMHLVVRADELHADSQLVPIATNAALEDIADAQFAPDLFHALRGMLVSHHCGARDNPKLVGT